jgi:hypothetical protein
LLQTMDSVGQTMGTASKAVLAPTFLL